MKTTLNTLRQAFTALVCVAGMGAAHAGLVGHTVSAVLYYPDLSSPYETYSNILVSDPGTIVSRDGFTSLSFTDSQIIITNLTAGAWSSDPFNGYVLDFGNDLAILGAAIDVGSSVDFSTGAVLGQIGNQVSLNFAGTCTNCVGGESIVINVNSSLANLPEPASLGLVALALAGAAASRQRRKV